MVNIINSLCILQKEFRRKNKMITFFNKEFRYILIIINGISYKLNNEYMINKIKYNDLFTHMNRLNKINQKLIEINRPITFKMLQKNNIQNINSKIQKIKYLLQTLIKVCGAKSCGHIMQILINRNWYKNLKNSYCNLFKLFNRLFIPISVNILLKNKFTSSTINLPYARKIDTTNMDLIMQLNGAELVLPLPGKTILIQGYFISDQLNNITYEKEMKNKRTKLYNAIKLNSLSLIFSKAYISRLSLRDFIIYTPTEIINIFNSDYKYLLKLKKENVTSIIKIFLQSTLLEQHKIISLFIIYNNDSKFIAHIIFDMVYSDSSLMNTAIFGSILYKNLHWNVQREFKKMYSEYEQYKKKIENLSITNISYETKINDMNVPDNIKDKALEKLKEINSSKDGSTTTKAVKYLDGLLKIPFGVFKEEEMITFLDTFKYKLTNFINTKLINNITDHHKFNTEFNNKNELNNHIILNTASDITIFFNNNADNPLLKLYLIEWNKYNIEKVTYIKYVRDTLNKCVYGHDTVKLQLERIFAQWINGKNEGVILGLHGPPGIGKTCIVKHGLSQCLKDENGNSRPFAFIPLGGATNGSYLDGHGYTYVGSAWGRIIDILMETKCMNPIILIDELDKVSKTEHGREIISILTHLTDSTQNSEFTDKYYTGIKFDLSKCLIIFTYNDISLIDRILLDRITTVEMKALSKPDKLVITTKYLLPEILKTIGYNKNDIIFNENVIEYIIDSYTYEAGVRKLKEQLFEIIREINLNRMFDNTIELPFYVEKKYIEDLFINKSKISITKIAYNPLCGVVNGLYATTAGIGGLTIIQVLKTISDSKEIKLEYTGNQGDVMKESIKCAKTIAWNIIPNEIKQKIKNDWELNGTYGLHIHCPDTSTPKDGPSAGGAITLAIISQLCNIYVKNTIAMTGEIDLNGNITAIGGVYSKLEGAISAGVTTVLLPKENEQDYNNIKNKLLVKDSDDEYRINVIFIKNIYDILENALENHNINFEQLI